MIYHFEICAPVIILFAIGPDKMTELMNAVPEWLISGFRIAGGHAACRRYCDSYAIYECEE